MNCEQFIQNATYSVKSQIGKQMDYLDSDLKSPNRDRVKLAKENINELINEIVGNLLIGVPDSQLKQLADYLESFKRQNYVNTMKATYYEDGYAYSTTLVELAICDYIINKANAKAENKNAEAERYQ